MAFIKHPVQSSVASYQGVLFILRFECLQNKFYIESKLNRDLREDLMKLFADHVAEKHVNTLMREYLI